MPNLSEILDRANDRLRAGRIGVTLEIRGRDDWLYLRGTFPPKPSSNQKRRHQQRIALNSRATPAAIKAAESTAKLIGIELNLGRFDWAQWGDAAPLVEPQVLTLSP